MQRYSVSWETKLNWLTSSSKGVKYAYCKTCEKDISCVGGLSDLRKHDKRESHISQQKMLKMPSKIDKFVHCAGARNAEIQICAWAAEHNTPPVVVEEFVKLSKNIFPDSSIAKHLTLGRTKASAIIRNVIGEAAHE